MALRAAGSLVAACVALTWSTGCSRTQNRPSKPNILLITIDTLRADRLRPDVAPTLDRLAASGVRFTNARSTAPLTLPSHTTIMTGLLPPSHGVRENGTDVLSDRHPTVARVLKDAGYATAALVGAFVLNRRFGLDQGFDTYDDQIRRDPTATDRLEAERPAAEVAGRALAWLDAWLDASPARQPFFVWIHVYDPHAPYTPPPEFREKAKSDYDGEIMYADAQVARLFEWLSEKGLRDRTVIVVAGDHGEGLGDHGERTHGMLVYDSTLRVPLIFAAPGQPAARRDDSVSLVDVAPTILRAAEVTPPATMQGRDLFAPRLRNEVQLKLDATSEGGMRDLYAETEYPRIAGWSPLQALTDGRWKTIRSAAGAELYDLQNDPQESHDLTAAQAGTVRGMTARIDAIRAAGGAAAGPRVISTETAERLRALGYVAGSPQNASSGNSPNPAAHIGTWNAFEDALAATASIRQDAGAPLARLARDHPTIPVFQTTYAQRLRETGNVNAALAIYRDAVKRWPTDATLLHDLSVTARAAANASGNPGSASARALRAEATRAEQAALALAPDSPSAHNGLGLLAIDEQRSAGAVHEFERATSGDPTNASYWTNLGNARRAGGDRAGAQKAYDKALSVDAGTLDALNGLGVLLVESNRAAEAVGPLTAALNLSPDFVEARLNLGIALQQTGQIARAAEEYRRVLAAPGRHARERDAAKKLLASLGARP